MLAVVTVGKPFFELYPLWSSRAHRVRKLELIPFEDFFTSTPWWGSITNLIFNVALFVPFGLLVVMLLEFEPFPRRRTLWIAGGVSLAIETAQYVFRLGFSDIDDLILNVVGAWIGATIVSHRRIRKRTAIILTAAVSMLVLGLLRFS
ncbi:VanZ like family protein [Corynebacterium kalinowskii]|uniref:VanZ like family protein n=1 Tax=Corynebacterium kalinowskii TaxID=2675216 RepID=A0A6B8W857_9CORY|nr:VanZ family protein [Corynebacterium kalinowskii]QGU03248.1 VanZ like family protein [Corynebacterium kalinowskii]